MSAGGAGRAGRIGLRAPTGEAEAPDDADDVDDADDPPERTLDELRTDADPQRFDTTYLVTSDDVPIAPTDPIDLPQPWQGLPRVAIVYNLNYVYDDGAGEWVRQTPFSGGGGGPTVVDSGTVSLAANGNADVVLPLTSYDLGGDTLLPTVAGASGASGSARFANQADGAGFNAVTFFLQYEPGIGNWLLRFDNGVTAPRDVAYVVQRVSP